MYSSRFAKCHLLVVVLTGFVWAANSTAHAEELTVKASVAKATPVKQGQLVQISIRAAKPSQLENNLRLRAIWTMQPRADAPVIDGPVQVPPTRPANLEITAQGKTSGSKLLHALDGDLFVVYRAPADGNLLVVVSAEESAIELFQHPRWREPGKVATHLAAPQIVKWSNDDKVDVEINVSPLELGDTSKTGLFVEAEPNDTPEQAQLIPLRDTTEEYSLHVIGGADDIEYFDNGEFGKTGDDWFRLDYDGKEPRLLTACISMPDQQVAARIRGYWIDPKLVGEGKANVVEGQYLPIAVYETGKNPNERAHQQAEQYRIAINRDLKPGGVFFLRVEANAPGYELELRVVKPAPYTDPRRAIKQGLYDHIGQVDAWITNRPRGASVERRIRDTGNLLGTNCMSCHTQSGVWGPAIPFEMGYRAENVQLFRHLVNTSYQSMRPTNVLKDSANNTSLRPLDIGDGPAGTRVAGHAVLSVERVLPPRKLQSQQALRASNFVLLTSDPGGINAAGPGANVGQGVVFNYAGEIVCEAWKRTGETRFFHAIEDKARRMLGINVKYVDDLGHRVEFFSRYFPSDYLAQVSSVAKTDGLDENKTKEALSKAQELDDKVRAQVKSDLARLRTVQLEGGAWSFDPGTQSGNKWNVKDKKADPAPTATALIGFQAAGIPKDDTTVAKAIAALLKMQHPSGYWKEQSQTGFVGTSYALHALSRYFPNIASDMKTVAAATFKVQPNESLSEAIRRVRAMSVRPEPTYVPHMIAASKHSSPFVRYWAMIGLGAVHSQQGLDSLIEGLGDRTKLVREAAHWGTRQTLIDDIGWDKVLLATRSTDDYRREAAMRALVMKVDGVLPKISVDWKRLTDAFAYGLNRDPHPAVRAWSTRAAWQWWVWNPPVRAAINDAWVELISREESHALVENAVRYQSHALFIANGHVANGSKEHQYKELETLFAKLHEKFTRSKGELKTRLAGRLVAIASTYYNQRGGDGGPGQMGYITKGSEKLFGDVLLFQLANAQKLDVEIEANDIFARHTIEGAANVPYENLQEWLVNFSLSGPEKYRGLAASSISDPRSVSLIAVPEKLEPMYRQLMRGASDPPRRKDLSEPILKMFGKVRWILPQSDEQREEIVQFMVPDISQWQPKTKIDSIGNAAEKTQAVKAADATWYLAEGLGKAVAENPDLHFNQLAESLPETFSNDAEARFWLRSIPWILSFKRDLPDVKIDPKKLPPIDPYEELRTRAVHLFLTQLTPDALAVNRKAAVDLANGTAMRRNPEILTALEKLESFEKDKGVIDRAKKILSQGRGNFLKELTAAMKKDATSKFAMDKAGNPIIAEEFSTDFAYFRDYVTPEMTKALRGDERSCMICHGEAGRVPSMELHAPDQVGYLPVEKLLSNYRILQERVSLEDVEKSKLLRKPLNVQTGKEDGHQGGRRYQPNDPGYQILRRWVLNQLPIQKKYGRPARSIKNSKSATATTPAKE
jgi:hypothetical protein